MLQLFVIALCAVSQLLNWKITKMAVRQSLRLKSWKLFYENRSCLLLMMMMTGK